MARSRLATVAALAVLVLLGLVTLGACGGDKEAPGPEPRRSTDADTRANLTILKPDHLPDGWRRVPGKDRLDSPPGTPRYCGVVAEPDPVREGRISYYEQASLPRSILEYGMLSTTDGATRTLDALQARRDDCVEPGAEATAVDVAVGDESVAWDVVQKSGPRYRTLVFRRGDTVVALVATGTPSVPKDELETTARAIDARLSGHD